MPEKEKIVLPTASFSFRLEGDSEIRANLLAQILSGFSESVFLLSKECSEFDGGYLSVSVVRPGSVDVLFTVAGIAQVAFPFIAQNASTIVSSIKGMLEIKKLIKGEKPKNIESNVEDGYMSVEAPDGSKVIAPLQSRIVITNPRVDKAISSIGEAARIHNAQGGFWFSQGDEQEYFSSDDVQDIAIQQPNVENSTPDNIRSTRTTLLIKSLDLLGGASWGFRYAGRTITAKIMDSEYMKSVHSGSAAYKAGDALDVELEITEIRSQSGEVLQERYVITKVYGSQVQTKYPT